MSALLMLLSQRLDPSRYESYNLIKMCKCMHFFYRGWMNSFAWSISLLYFSWMWTIFLFFFFRHALWACGIPSLGMHFYYFFSFFWHAFWACGMPSLGMHLLFLLLLLFFFIAHILDSHFREKESWYVMEFYFVGGWQCFAIFQCRRIAYEWTCTWSWSWESDTSLPRVKEFDKTQSKVKLHMKVREWKSNFGFGRNFHYFEETSYWWVFLRNPKYFAKKSMVPLIQSYRISQLLRKHGVPMKIFVHKN